MPRPPLKRRKPNHKSPARRVESPKNAQLRQQLDRQLADKPIGQRPADSDDSDRLVTRTPSTAGRRSTLRKEIYASGAIAKGDRPGAYPTRAETRRNLQNDTAKILRESRSRSQSTSNHVSEEKPPAGTKLTAKKSSPAILNKLPLQSISTQEPPRTTTKVSRVDGLSRTGSTPLGEPSILGTLKPRKRQASILRLIDNEDSSIIHPEDEDRFLPDDESTPLNNTRVNKLPSSGQLLSSGVSSRKRKFRAGESEIETSHLQTSFGGRLRTASPHQTTPSSASHTLSGQGTYAALPESLSPHPNDEDDDVMAMPRSSSPESTPEVKLQKPAKKQKLPPVSTEQLQSLMPSKRRRGARERTKRTEFDISQDTSDPSEEADHSAFLPNKAPKRQKKGSQGKKSTTSTQTRKSTTLASPRLVSRLRTPLPLTRSINGENRKLRSPSSQQSLPIVSKDPNGKRNGGPSNMDTNSIKQSGGSHPITKRRGRSTRKGKTAESQFDQENMDAEEMADPVENDVQSGGRIVSLDNYGLPDNTEPEIEVGRGSNPRNDESSTRGHSTGVEKSLGWNSRWADIDEWSLDFEEVDVSTGSSSPLRR